RATAFAVGHAPPLPRLTELPAHLERLLRRRRELEPKALALPRRVERQRDVVELLHLAAVKDAKLGLDARGLPIARRLAGRKRQPEQRRPERPRVRERGRCTPAQVSPGFPGATGGSSHHSEGLSRRSTS